MSSINSHAAFSATSVGICRNATVAVEMTIGPTRARDPSNRSLCGGFLQTAPQGVACPMVGIPKQ